METTFNNFKDIAKVGKRLLVQIVGICENHKEETIVEEIDYDSCPATCAFKKFDNEAKRNICMNHCPLKKVTRTPKVVYMNEKHKYQIKKVETIEAERLSKYQMLQLLTYHFLGVNSQGFVPYVSTKELATKLNCTVRTIRNNNNTLAKLGLISITSYGSDLFGVHITGYDTYHLTQKEGGTGYVQMSKSFIEALFGMENVNSMRLAIRALMKFDDEIEVKKGDSCFYSFNDIKLSMPSHINHKKIIIELLSNVKEVFTIKETVDGLFISLHEKYNGKTVKKQKEEEYGEEINTYATEESISLGAKDVEDLTQLSLEYGGVEPILEALDVYKKHISSTHEKIKNIGGYIRIVIKRNFINRIVFKVA